MKFYLVCFFLLSLFTHGFTQNAAVSSHINFGPTSVGDIQISEVRVPSNGLATNTYYETIGFWGNKGNSTGNGYGGIQESSDYRGNKVHIFSIWHALDNPSDTANFPYSVYLNYDMQAEYFGGEGVGLKTWNLTNDPEHPLYWETDVWYTHVIRVWDVEEHTYYAFFVRDGADSVWRHLSTIGVREATIRIQGDNDAFLEDWSGSGENRREMHLRNNWRRDQQGSWQASQYGDYSVNYWDLEQGARSYNYRTNWDGGTASDATGDYYYMISGGNSTSPTSPLSYPGTLSQTFNLSNSLNTPPYAKIQLEEFTGEVQGDSLQVQWSLDSTTLPQFAVSLTLLDSSGITLAHDYTIEPQKRNTTLTLEGYSLLSEKGVLVAEFEDILGNFTADTLTFGEPDTPSNLSNPDKTPTVSSYSFQLVFKENRVVIEKTTPSGEVFEFEINGISK